jgi:DNA-binding SARP family transcriptional activator
LSEDESVQILRRRGIQESGLIAQLHHAVDGWVGGLALLSAHCMTKPASWSVNLTGREAVFAYFAGQIFERESLEHREVLMKTALMPHVTPDAASALSGNAHAPQLLEQLYRRQYFIDRRTEPQLSYRYHDLFREFLLSRVQTQLDAATLCDLRAHAGRLLLESGELERAMELLCESGRFDEAQAVLLARAPLLLGQGRWKTVLEAIKLFPVEQVTDSAPLRCWSGMALIAADPIAARRDLEGAFQLFQRAGDAIGQLTSIVGIIASYFIQDSSISAYADLIDPMAHLFARIDRWPGRAIELEARAMFLLAASHVRPDHPLLGSMALSVLELLRDDEVDPNTRAAAGLRALVYFMWTGEVDSAGQVDALLDALFASGRALPVHVAMGYAFRALYQHTNLADSDAASLSVDRALAIAKENGLSHSESIAYQFQAIINAGLGRNPDVAEAALRRVAALGFEGNLNREANYHLQQAYVYKWRCDAARALHHAQLCARAARANGRGFLIFLGSKLPNIYVDAGELEAAQTLLSEVWAVARLGCFANFEATLLLEDAYLALHRHDRPLCHERLRQALHLMQTESRHLAVVHFTGGAIPTMFSEALDFNIRADFVRELIGRWKVPAPSQPSAHWPWPLSVRTLGRFEIELHGKPIAFGRKAPRKVLALLKALIALGSIEVPEQALIDALWPMEEGDAAHSSYAMTLSRLRRLLGDGDFLQQRAGKLSLHRRKCCVDAWAFDGTMRQSAAATSGIEHPSSDGISAFSLYRGMFLPEELDTPWAAPMRERLRSRFVQTVAGAAHELENSGQHESAMKLYQRGLDADDMAEDFYQGLMRCHAAAGRNAEVAATYFKLKRLLSISLGVKPSPLTEQVYEALCRQRESAAISEASRRSNT